MGEFQFVDELPPRPAPTKRLTKRQRFIRALMANPGKWAIYPSNSEHSGAALKIHYPNIEVEVRKREQDKFGRGGFVTYARWVD